MVVPKTQRTDVRLLLLLGPLSPSRLSSEHQALALDADGSTDKDTRRLLLIP
jgi:hypothetical protein